MLGKRQKMRTIAAHAVLPGHDQFAFRQLLRHQVSRHQRYTAAGLGSTEAHIEGVEARPVVAVGRMQTLFEEPLMPGLWA
ncbi:hypothetical protein D3C78_901170 [compost metagenome]